MKHLIVSAALLAAMAGPALAASNFEPTDPGNQQGVAPSSLTPRTGLGTAPAGAVGAPTPIEAAPATAAPAPRHTRRRPRHHRR